MRTGRVTTDFHADYPDHLMLLAGIILTPVERESEWPGWVWCVHDSGVECWVPKDYLEKQGETALLVKDYNAQELNVVAGQQVAIVNSVSGWYWCLNQAGEEGWIPQKYIEIVID